MIVNHIKIVIIITYYYKEIKMSIRECEEEFKKDFYGDLDTIL